MKNKKRLSTVTNSRTFNILNKGIIFDGNCHICQKRTGSYYANCDGKPRWGFHGNGKPIFSKHRRAYKTWKYNRKTKWK